MNKQEIEEEVKKIETHYGLKMPIFVKGDDGCYRGVAHPSNYDNPKPYDNWREREGWQDGR